MKERKWLRPSIGTKLLMVIIPALLVGAIVMFMTFEDFSHTQRISEIRSRLDGFTATQATALVKPVWEFDDGTVDLLFEGYAKLPELLSAELRGTHDEVIATPGFFEHLPHRSPDSVRLPLDIGQRMG